MVRVVEQIYTKVCTNACRIYVALYNINKILFFQPQVSLHVNGTKVQRGWRKDPECEEEEGSGCVGLGR